MPCTSCKSDFNVFNWKIRCLDCEQYYCSKCLHKVQGGFYCKKCFILNKRPPDREKLMELRAKDLRDYLNKNHISTHGLVEKAELVELFQRCAIPVHNRRNQGRFGSVLTGSVPNLATQSHEQIHNIRSNINSNISNVRNMAENAFHNLGRRVGPTGNLSSNSSPRMGTFQGNTYFNPQFVHTPPMYAAPPSVPSPPSPPQHTTNNMQDTGSSPYPQQHTGFTNIAAETEASPPPPEAPKYPKLSDFQVVEDLNELSVKQLKELLTLNRVNYKGCVEKTELLERATRLWIDNNQHKIDDLEEETVDNLCKICMDAPLDCVLLECGHIATCIDCGKRLADCPICRQYVSRVVRTFKV